ncbi:MAG: DUF1667 domain-containing protein [Clostridia bacterium]
MIKNMTCIMCPMGCNLTAEEKDNEIIISGNTCNRGEKYGKQEFVSPMRIVTTLVKLKNGKVAPVKTSKAIPKSKIVEVLDVIKEIEYKSPTVIGDKVIDNVCNLNADIVITKNVD